MLDVTVSSEFDNGDILRVEAVVRDGDWLPVDPFTSLEKEAFVVLFSLLQDFGDQLLTVLVAKFPDIEFLVRDSSVRGDVLEHDRSHTVVSREFLQCGPFQGFLVVLLSSVCR